MIYTNDPNQNPWMQYTVQQQPMSQPVVQQMAASPSISAPMAQYQAPAPGYGATIGQYITPSQGPINSYQAGYQAQTAPIIGSSSQPQYITPTQNGQAVQAVQQQPAVNRAKATTTTVDENGTILIRPLTDEQKEQQQQAVQSQAQGQQQQGSQGTGYEAPVGNAVGTGVGYYGGNQAVQYYNGLNAATPAASPAASTTATSASASAPAASTGASAGGTGASGSATAVGSTTMADGSAGVLMSDGSVVAAGSEGTGASAASAVGPWLGLAGMSYLYGKPLYEHGKPILEGEASSDDVVKAALMSNMMTAWAVPILDAMGIQVSKSGMHEDAIKRKQVRKVVRDNSDIYGDEESFVKLANGNVYDTREDGGLSYNIDWSGDSYGVNKDKLDNVIGTLDPLGNAFTLGTKGRSAALTSELSNAALRGGGNIDENITAIYKNSGMKRDEIAALITGLSLGEGAPLGADKRDALLATIDRVYRDSDGNIVNEL